MLKGCRWTSLVQFSKKRMYLFLLQSKQPQNLSGLQQTCIFLSARCAGHLGQLCFRQLHVSFILLDQQSLGWMIFMVNGSTRGVSGHRMPFKRWVCTYHSLFHLPFSHWPEQPCGLVQCQCCKEIESGSSRGTPIPSHRKEKAILFSYR